MVRQELQAPGRSLLLCSIGQTFEALVRPGRAPGKGEELHSKQTAHCGLLSHLDVQHGAVTHARCTVWVKAAETWCELLHSLTMYGSAASKIAPDGQAG